MPAEKIFDYIDASRETVVELQRMLTAVPALGPRNGGSGEWGKARVLAGFLKARGFPEPEVFAAPDAAVAEGGSRPNLVYRLAGSLAGPTRWIVSHLDVVPAGEGWKGDPFVLRVEGDRVIGRGVLDNQQGLVSSVVAMEALMRSGVPHFPVGLVFVADEETGSEFGLGHLLEKHAVFGVGDLIVVPDAGNPESTMIEVAEKGVLWVKVETRGKQSHGSRPGSGKNALLAAAKLMVKLEGLYEKYPRRDELFSPPLSTFEVTKKPSNLIENVNTIPGQDVFYVDCRLVPGVRPPEVLEVIMGMAREVEAEMKAAGRYADVPLVMTVSVENLEEAAPATSPTAAVVRGLQAGIRAVYGVEGRAMGIGGGTVAALLRRAGLPAAVWATMDGVAHQAEEHSRISFTLGDAKVMAHLCANAVAEWT